MADEENSTASSQTALKNIVSGLLTSLGIEDTSISVSDSFDPETGIDGKGAVTAVITRTEQPNPGLPDWFLDVSVMGMTFASEDPTKEIIRGLFCGVCNAVQTWTPSTLSTALGATVAGIHPISQGALQETEDRFTFTVDFRLVLTDFTF